MDNSSYTGKRDELLIFDDANRYAKASGTIGYEILAGLHPKIKREVI
jgi:alanine racemase